ncbi:Uma2 family endonuclease [Streptomyces griseosporeus]|uniref:Uma2 family endonuclease n=1 Tax=Streptomyces griseosporeus TaxID=1910 RepID=UPI0036F7A552
MPGDSDADVETAFQRLSAAVPRGWRVELIEGEIYVTPPANGEHEEFLSELTHQVGERRHDRSLRNYTGIGLDVPGASGTGHVVPDLVVAAKGSFDNKNEWHDPSPVLLVAEVTSDSTAERDREKKIHGYARAGIPVYLLIDRQEGEVTVYSEPSGDSYARAPKHKLGQAVPLPAPLGFELDTAEF